MRILLVVPCYYPATRFGGPIKSIHELARGLVAAGNEVIVFTTNSNGAENLATPLAVETLMDGVKIFYFPVAWPRGYFRSPRMAEALRRQVRTFDIVYAAWMYVYSTAVAARECARQRVSFVISPRGMLDRNAVRLRSRMKKLVYLSLVGRAAVKSAAAVHFTSPGERDNCLVPVELDKSLVVANGIELRDDREAIDPDAELARMGVPREGPIVLFLGRLSYIKGLDLLSRAWPIVSARCPSAHLVIAGPDDEGLTATLREFFVSSGMATSTSFVGMVEGPAKFALLNSCSLLVSPSYLESFGMAIVEAMAAGKAVVVTDRVNIAPDIEAAGAGLVTRCDVEEISEAIVTLLENPVVSKSMGLSAREFVRREYAIDKTISRMSAAFESIVANARKPTVP